MDLWNQGFSQHYQPLAERMRPQSIDEIIGQSHLVGEHGVINNHIKMKSIPSMILWGPPGIGKTTLANIIAKSLDMPFATLSAISSGVKDVREIITKAKHQPRTILFIDEIHRFNKSQQDALLGAVEKGFITLIGATTENPSFEVNAALLSRCQVYTLKPLTKDEMKTLVNQALTKDAILKSKSIEIKEYDALFKLSNGDARKLLNLLEVVVESLGKNKIAITDKIVQDCAQQKVALYDKNGEQHYDIVSAMIKSIRGSDPNAALYWMMRMIEGGEDVKFIARRLLISASEDVGHANPTALVIANNCFQAVNVIGYPEAEIILSQCVTYLASSAKSNASYLAIKKAKKLVKETGDLPVPLHLRNAPTKLMKEQGYGKGYKYSHDYPNNFAYQEFMPEGLEQVKLYEPGENAREAEFRKRLKFFWQDKYDY
ncbi:replication-associated recombination protein A [Aureibacter tunicatorum]|uniref:Replication-associated recombination protein A n=1 Tax=Aureibacter tunicatorum TaxID=866807 RepID=A0AAE4BS95_9BACT|nr:replication-associated recombination protein A [Aureibacter tunicatorum]MDR6238137.1 putative ATPase [Aureibacter tunicatorum]BDD03170.1 ATPase AAA [Aureibacter tunicatorum]